MTREELIAWCRRAPDVGAVKHEEFADYITLIERRRRVDGRMVSQETPYMSVDGRLAMANADHRRQEKRLDFESPVVLSDTEGQLTLMVVVVSEVYGRRHGIATSKRGDGSPIEMAHPWEIAETSATGRALAAMGYGLLPGTGLSSAEDVERAGFGRRPDRVSARQRVYLVDGYARREGLAGKAAQAGLERVVRERYGVGLPELSVDQGRELSEWLRQPAEPSGNGQAPVKQPAPARQT